MRQRSPTSSEKIERWKHETTSAAQEIEDALRAMSEDEEEKKDGEKSNHAENGEDGEGIDDNEYYSDYDYDEEANKLEDEEQEDDDFEIPEIQRIECVIPGHCNIPEIGIAKMGETNVAKISLRSAEDILDSNATAPNISCLTLEGRVTSLGQYFQNGKPTLVCFYVPWSGPCSLAAVEMENHFSEYGGAINFVLVNVDYRGTIMKNALEVSKTFSEEHKLKKITHLVMEEDAKMRLGLYGAEYFPHFSIVGSTAVRNRVLLNFDNFDWEAVRRMNALTKETVASRSANSTFISKRDLKTIIRYLKYKVRDADIEKISTASRKAYGDGILTRDFLIQKF
eukprot:g1477.t1